MNEVLVSGLLNQCFAPAERNLIACFPGFFAQGESCAKVDQPHDLELAPLEMNVSN